MIRETSALVGKEWAPRTAQFVIAEFKLNRGDTCTWKQMTDLIEKKIGAPPGADFSTVAREITMQVGSPNWESQSARVAVDLAVPAPGLELRSTPKDESGWLVALQNFASVHRLDKNLIWTKEDVVIFLAQFRDAADRQFIERLIRENLGADIREE